MAVKKNIDQWTMGKQLIRGISFLLAIILMIGITAFFSFWYIKIITLDITDDALPGLVITAELRATVLEQQLDLMRHLLSRSPQEMDDLENRIFTRQIISDKLYNEYEKTVMDEQERKDFEEVIRARTTYRQLRRELLYISQSESLETGEKYHRAKVRPAFEAYESALKNLYQFNHKLTLHLVRRTQTVVTTATLAINILCGMGIVLGIIFTILLVAKVNYVIRLLTEMIFARDEVASEN